MVKTQAPPIEIVRRRAVDRHVVDRQNRHRQVRIVCGDLGGKLRGELPRPRLAKAEVVHVDVKQAVSIAKSLNIEFLAQVAENLVPARAVHIAAGTSGRQKIVDVDDVDADAARTRLLAT